MLYREAKRATLGLLASTCLIAPATAQTYQGIYVVSIPYVNGSAATLTQAVAYRKPFVDGVVIILHWSYLEPVAPGQTLPPGANITDPFTGEVFCPQGTQHTNFCWQELDEQLAHSLLVAQTRERKAAIGNTVGLGERDQRLCHATKFFRLRQSGADQLMLDQRRGHVLEHRFAVAASTVELTPRFHVTHDKTLLSVVMKNRSIWPISRG